MKTVARMAIEKGCIEYKFACVGWNTPALNFYKSKGARDLTDIEDWHMLDFEKERMHELASNLGQG